MSKFVYALATVMLISSAVVAAEVSPAADSAEGQQQTAQKDADTQDAGK